MAQLHILRKNLIYEAKFIFLGRPLSFDFEIYKSTDIYIYMTFKTARIYLIFLLNI